jgi:hypothetical protein
MKLNDKYDNIKLNDIKLNDIKLNNIKLNDKYYYKYLKYKKKYLQFFYFKKTQI